MAAAYEEKVTQHYLKYFFLVSVEAKSKQRTKGLTIIKEYLKILIMYVDSYWNILP